MKYVSLPVWFSPPVGSFPDIRDPATVVSGLYLSTPFGQFEHSTFFVWRGHQFPRASVRESVKDVVGGLCSEGLVYFFEYFTILHGDETVMVRSARLRFWMCTLRLWVPVPSPRSTPGAGTGA